MRFLAAAFALLLCILPIAGATETKPVAAQPDLSGEAVVVERMSTIIRVAPDGSATRTFSMTTHLLSDAGVRQQGVLSVIYSAARETPHIDFVRVHKPDSKVVETPTNDAQEVPVPVTQAAPMYSDVKAKQLPVRSLGVGDTLEYQVTVQETNPDAPGAFWRSLNFTEGAPVKQETVELRLPGGMAALVKSKNVRPLKSEEGGEQVYRWTRETASEYPKKKEKDAAPVALVPALFEPDIAITTCRTWAELGAWYQGLMKDRAIPDAAIQAKADELTKGLATVDEKIDALYHYVATQFRYISVSLGVGRVQPHTATEVFRNQYGDCKDKHTLLQAMLAAEKIEAVPVLIHSSLRLSEELPMPGQFDHMITLVRPGPHQIWLDTTPEVAPSRVLMLALRDKQALVVPAHGAAYLTRTPSALPFPAYQRQTVTGSLDAAGTLTAHFDQTTRGDIETILRMVYHQVPRANWQELQQNISYQTGFSGEVSAVDAALPETTTDPFHLSWDYKKKDFGDWPNRKIVGISPGWGQDMAADGKAPERAMLLAADEPVESDVVLTLPDGYTLTPPADVLRTTPFAEYRSTYLVKGRTVEMKRRLVYKVRELPVSEWTAFREFQKAVSDDAGQMMQLTEITPAAKATATAETHEPTLVVPPSPPVLSPEDRKTGMLIGQAEELIRANEIPKARVLLQQAEQRNRQLRGLWMAWGDLERHSHNLAAAASDYQKEIDSHPEFFWAYPELIAIRVKEEDWKAAEATARAWKAANPAEPKVLERLAWVLNKEARYKEAADAYQAAVAANPGEERLRLQLGEAQLKAGELTKGKATLMDLMAHSAWPGMFNAGLSALADSEADLTDVEAAGRTQIEKLERLSVSGDLKNASQQDFQNASLLAATWETMGWIAYKQKRMAEAESYARSAWLMTEQPSASLHLGRIYEAEGKSEDALRVYRLGSAALQAGQGSPEQKAMQKELERRASALITRGVHEPAGSPAPHDREELAALHRYSVPNPLKDGVGWAEYLILMGDDQPQEVQFMTGTDALRTAEASLRGVAYHTPLPVGSHAKVLRRGNLACAAKATSCSLTLYPIPEAPHSMNSGN